MTVRMLPIEVRSDHELLAVATFAIDSSGEHKMTMSNVVDASVTMCANQQARALRMLATAVEAEAIGQGPKAPPKFSS